jgi:hypothetical protein
LVRILSNFILPITPPKSVIVNYVYLLILIICEEKICGFFCCGMYRSASTLQFQIVSQLVKEADIGQQIGWIDAQRFLEVRNSYQSDKQLKVVKVHQFTDAIGKEFTQDNALGIYTFRDIRDVYVSMMQQQQKLFDDIWNWHGREFIQTCLDNYKQWTRLPRVLVSQYENIFQSIPRKK